MKCFSVEFSCMKTFVTDEFSSMKIFISVELKEIHSGIGLL